MKNVYHIHDECCGHATNTLNSIVQTALNNQYRELFFTEHCPLDNNNIIFRPTREELQDLKIRIAHVNKQYEGILTIHFGYEVEFSKWNPKYFETFKNDPICEFVIFGNHYLGDMWKNPKLIMDELKTATDLKEYYENLVLAMKTKMFSWFAHPDIFLNAYQKWDKYTQELTNKIIKLCEQYDMPIGFNANGFHNATSDFDYPSRYFWREIAKSKIKVVIEADSHTNIVLEKEWLEKTKALALEYGLEKNLVDTVKIHWLHNHKT